MRTRDPLDDSASLIPRVYAYVSYRLGPGADAEDVTSETFARAVRYRESFRPGRGEPITWLLGIAQRCIASHFANSPTVAEQHDEPMSDADALSDLVVERLTLREAFATLNDRDRELLGLRYGADLSARQIAELMEMRPNTVEVALHRSLARLSAILEPDEHRIATAEPQPDG